MIVVTGGAGFIGSCILARLQELGGKDLVVVDNLGTGDKWKNIAKRELAAVVLPKDMFDFLHARESEIDAVIHMGAISTTTETDCDLIAQTNFTLSWKLWEFCRDHEKRFFYASSAATYGAGENGFVDNASLDYLNNLRPLNPYGWSKCVFDRKIAREIAEGRKTPKQWAGFKFFNVYGPNEYHKGGQKSVIAHIFPLVRDGKQTPLFKSYNPNYKDGEQKRDFVWVGDIVNVICWMLLKAPQVNGLFNIGSGEARTFYDLAVATWTAVGKEPKITFKDMPETLREKYQYFTQADLTKLRAVGYPYEMTKLEDGVRQYVQNYLNKQDMYM